LEKGPACPVGRGKGKLDMLDGSVKGNVWGTYIHGIFDNDGLRSALLNSLRKKKGLPARKMIVNYQAKREEAINKWADTIKNSIDICFILRHVGMEYCMKSLSEGLK
jgi:adenosylcobyric acid synthase